MHVVYGFVCISVVCGMCVHLCALCWLYVSYMYAWYTLHVQRA